jgi:alkylation response protein AidB-like acyl-CoA dehydrogenase
MGFDLTADQKLFRATTREFLEKEMPLTRVRELADRGIGFEPDWWQRGSELGWNAMLVDPAAGGDSISGEGLVDACIVAEEMGRLVSPGPLLRANLVAAALSEAANAGDHAEVIAALMAGEAVASWAVYEPRRGWAPLTPAVQATPRGLRLRPVRGQGPGRLPRASNGISSNRIRVARVKYRRLPNRQPWAKWRRRREDAPH